MNARDDCLRDLFGVKKISRNEDWAGWACKLLKSHKMPKRILGKAWRKKRFIWIGLTKKQKSLAPYFLNLAKNAFSISPASLSLRPP